MKKITHSGQVIKVLIGVFFLLAFAPALYAAIYYVDATNGQDINNGISQATAWQTIAKVNASRFIPGDQILFKRGEVWRETLIVASSGTAGSPITFGAYGSGGKPKILGSVAKNSTSDWESEIVGGQANTWRTASTADIGHIYADGSVLGVKKSTKAECTSQGNFFWDSSNKELYIYSTSNPATYYNGSIELAKNWGGGLVYVSDKDFVVIEDFDIRHSGSHGIQTNNSDSVTIRRNDLSYIGGVYFSGTIRYGNGIELWNKGSNMLVQNNTISQTFDEGATSQSASTGIRNNQIFEYNTIDKCGRGFAFSTYSGNPIVGGAIIRYNTITDSGLGWATPSISNGEGKGIQLNCPQATASYCTGNVIRNTASGPDPIGQGILLIGGEWTLQGNTIENSHNTAIRVFGDPTATIAYNKIIGPNDKPCFFSHGDGSNANQTIVANNTCYAPDSSTGFLFQFGAPGGFEVTNHLFKNNIVMLDSSSSTALVYVSPSSTIVSDYNLFYRSTSGKLITWSNGTTYTQAQWANYKTDSKQDAHSINSNPLLGNPAAGDFRPQPGSPAINAGASIGLSMDFAGQQVPYGAAPDIGAYECHLLAPLLAPRNLRIKIN